MEKNETVKVYKVFLESTCVGNASTKERVQSIVLSVSNVFPRMAKKVRIEIVIREVVVW